MEDEIGFQLLLSTFYACQADSEASSGKFTRVKLRRFIERKYKGAIGSELKLKESTIENYFNQSFNKGIYNIISNKSDVSDAMAVACGKKSFEDFVKTNTTHTSEQIEYAVKVLKIKRPLRIIEDLPDYFISDSEFEELEFNHSGIIINCITHSLFWAETFIPLNAQKILERKNQYNYLLTESVSGGLTRKKQIERHISRNHGLENYISIYSLYEHPDLCPKHEGIAFPIANDIVIYQKLDEQNNPIFHKGIIGTKVDQKYHKNNFSIEIETERAKAILEWFEFVWGEIEKRSRKDS